MRSTRPASTVRSALLTAALAAVLSLLAALAPVPTAHADLPAPDSRQRGCASAT